MDDLHGRVPGCGHAARVPQGHDRAADDPGRLRRGARPGQHPGEPGARQRRDPVRALRRADLRLPGDLPRRVQLQPRWRVDRPGPAGHRAGVLLLRQGPQPLPRAHPAQQGGQGRPHVLGQQVLPGPPLRGCGRAHRARQ
ncbi:hypothetical protein B7486_68495, partial [cyanobacterium TDX16]